MSNSYRIKGVIFVTLLPNYTLILVLINNHDMRESLVTDTLPDKEIIMRVVAGEKELYAAIIKRYNQRLYRIAMSIVNDDMEVEDIMQVSYINAWENLGRFAFRSSFATWLTRILINESLLRLKKRGKSINMNDETMENELSLHSASAVQTPVATLLNAELKSVLEDAISMLPEKYRVVFVMREIEGMNVADTMECLEISEANVKVRLNRAKSLLKTSLALYYKKEEILHFYLTRCDRILQNVMNNIGG